MLAHLIHYTCETDILIVLILQMRKLKCERIHISHLTQSIKLKTDTINNKEENKNHPLFILLPKYYHC